MAKVKGGAGVESQSAAARCGEELRVRGHGRDKLTPVRGGWTERLALAVSALLGAARVTRGPAGEVAVSFRVLALVQRALDGEDVRAEYDGDPESVSVTVAMSMGQRNVINAAKAWVRGVDRRSRELGWAPDLSADEKRLYLAAQRLLDQEERARKR